MMAIKYHHFTNPNRLMDLSNDHCTERNNQMLVPLIGNAHPYKLLFLKKFRPESD